MAKYVPLTFMGLLDLFQTNKKSVGKNEKFKDLLENDYSQILEYLNLTGK